jgi:hypothetical protein
MSGQADVGAGGLEMDAQFTPTSEVGAGRVATGPPKQGDGVAPEAGKRWSEGKREGGIGAKVHG